MNRPRAKRVNGGNSVARQLTLYAQLMRFDKPVGIWLLMWPTLWALWLASDGHPGAENFIIFMLGVVIMRAAGCVINDLADRKLDAHVERTRMRPLATGAVSPMEAVTLFAALSLLAIGLVAMLNRQAQILAVAGALLTVSYPFLKRFVSVPQFVLGAAFGWAVPMVFAAETGELPQLSWLLFSAALVWATIYDTYYAMVDREDDKKIGIRSTAILFGDADRFIIGGLQILMLVALTMVGSMAAMGPWYYAGLVAAGNLMAYHQWLSRKRDPAGCFRAFLHNHYIGMVVFFGIALHYVFLEG